MVLTKAHLLMTEFYQSIDIEAYRREIEGAHRNHTTRGILG